MNSILPDRDVPPAFYGIKRMPRLVVKIMRQIIVLLLVCTFFNTVAQTKNPFLLLKYDRVVMYDMEKAMHPEEGILDTAGKFLKFVSKQVELSKQEAAELTGKLGLRSSFGGGTAACFEPHLGFAYYYRQKIVAHVSICMDCNRLYPSLDIPAQLQGKQGKGKDIYYVSNGMSPQFRKFLNGWLKKHKFSHQVQKEDVWGGY